MGGPYCACLVVRFKPVRDEARGSYAERWVCEECGAEFVRKPQAEDVIDPGAHEDEMEKLDRRLAELCLRASGIGEIPAAAEFAASVEEKLEDMRCWLSNSGSLTPRQLEAVDNMEGGIARWEERL